MAKLTYSQKELEIITHSYNACKGSHSFNKCVANANASLAYAFPNRKRTHQALYQKMLSMFGKPSKPQQEDKVTKYEMKCSKLRITVNECTIEINTNNKPVIIDVL